MDLPAHARPAGRHPDRRALLCRVPLFRRLDDATLATLGDAVEEIRVVPGTAITHEGAVESWFFVIAEGAVRVDRGGRTINRLGPGAFFGEIALLDGGPRTATVIAEEESLLLTMDRHRFAQLLAASPAIQASVLEAVGSYLRRLDEEAAT